MKQFMWLALIPMLMVAGCGHSENGKEIHLRPRDQYIINLEENPTTGYNWQIYVCDLRIYDIVENEFIPPDSNMSGAPGRRRVVIEATNPGKGEFEMVYIRPWEKDVEPIKRINYTFYVSAN